MLLSSFSLIRAGNLESEWHQINNSRVASLVKAIGCGFAGYYTGMHAWDMGERFWHAIPHTFDGKEHTKITFQMGTLTGANAYMTYLLWAKWGWNYVKHAFDIK
jgi:hypothetical protein